MFQRVWGYVYEQREERRGTAFHSLCAAGKNSIWNRKMTAKLMATCKIVLPGDIKDRKWCIRDTERALRKDDRILQSWYQHMVMTLFFDIPWQWLHWFLHIFMVILLLYHGILMVHHIHSIVNVGYCQFWTYKKIIILKKINKITLQHINRSVSSIFSKKKTLPHPIAKVEVTDWVNNFHPTSSPKPTHFKKKHSLVK